MKFLKSSTPVILTAVLLSLMSLSACSTAPKSAEGKAELRRTSADALSAAQANDPTLREVIRKSAGYAVFPSVGKGAIYVAFCVSTIAVIAGRASQNGEQQQKTWTARVLAWPGGPFLVGVAGAAIVAGGIYLIVRGLTTKFEDKLETGRMGPGVRRASLTLGLVGSVGRGVVFGLIGILLVGAAINHDRNQAQGIDGTLRTIADRAYGQVLLFLTALALFAFAAYSMVEARYRRM